MSISREAGHDVVVDGLRSAGLRVTKARAAIASVIAGAETPVGMGEIETRLADNGIPRSTVYRVVNELTELGLVRRYEFDEGFARYEAAEPVKGHHHHFICRSCRSVLEVDETADLERHLAKAEARLERRDGITIEGHRVDLFGLCSDCGPAVKRQRRA